MTKLPDGVETLTESVKSEVARKIKEHVNAMHARVKEGRGIHLRDPLIAAIFKDHRKITMALEETKRGVKVRETFEDPYSVKLIQAHAAVVNQFVAKGRPEMRNDHPVPQKEGKWHKPWVLPCYTRKNPTD